MTVRDESEHSASDYEARYTASELATMLAANEALYRGAYARLGTARRALSSLARGEWTADGARVEAQRALKAMQDA